jgi:hypothetical protein
MHRSAGSAYQFAAWRRRYCFPDAKALRAAPKCVQRDRKSRGSARRQTGELADLLLGRILDEVEGSGSELREAIERAVVSRESCLHCHRLADAVARAPAAEAGSPQRSDPAPRAIACVLVDYSRGLLTAISSLAHAPISRSICFGSSTYFSVLGFLAAWRHMFFK